eukprot:gene15179-16741_t
MKIFMNWMLLSTIIVISNGDTKTSKHKGFFLSVVDMKPLVELEHKLTKPFLELVKGQEEKLGKLEAMVNRIDTATREGADSLLKLTDFIGNPVNALKMIHRSTQFWPSLVDKLSNSPLELQTRLKKLLSLYKKDFPEEQDVNGAIASVFNLQDTYKISPQSFADGFGARAHRLIIEEIFELGYIALGQGDYAHAQSWLKECYERFHPEAQQIGFLDKASLLEYLAWSEYKMGNLEEAIALTEKVLEIKPDSTSANANIQFFEEDFAKIQSDPKSRHKKQEKKKDKRWLKQQIMCNEEDKMDKEIKAKLFCRYEVPNPVFTLSPVRAEDTYLKPKIMTYHNFLSEFEMEHIKKMGRKKLKRATVHDPKTGVLTYANYRTSKSAWIREDEDAVVGKIFQRVQALTGLDMMFCEPLQVNNYGIGGRYEPHYDHATNNKSTVLLKGWRNRIATALIYLSDVKLGGDTVFLEAGPGVTTKPRKGDLIFWYNMKKSGKGDLSTLHAACPVLLGNKWVGNFWIHEYGQEFRRKCGLTEDEV